MAENFKSLVDQQKKTNEHLEQLVEVADPGGAAAKEKKTEEEQTTKKDTGYLKTMAAGITGLWGKAKQKLKIAPKIESKRKFPFIIYFELVFHLQIPKCIC